MKDQNNEITGYVFDVIRGSFVDGFGIRTTFFLKGCPLRCRWCCNPESQEKNPQLKVVYEDCTGCGECAGLCDALSFKEPGRKLSVNFSACSLCGKCMEVCPTNTLSVWGRAWTVEEAFELLKKDRLYYENSGGGVTLGGGEATMQAQFTYALMKKLQEEGIHVAVDTCGFTVSDLSLKILEEADTILFDLKGMDPEKHREYTGVDPERIHRNLLHLGKRKKEIIIRLPLIPGITDGEETIRQEAALIREAGSVRRIDILPFHEYGRVKYGQIGKEYRMDGFSRQSDEKLETIKALLSETGVPVQVGG